MSYPFTLDDQSDIDYRMDASLPFLYNALQPLMGNPVLAQVVEITKQTVYTPCILARFSCS